jgi:heme/copper-type cytochrome/quinol oxidase subunit 3
MWIFVCAAIASVGLLIGSYFTASEKRKKFDLSFGDFCVTLLVQLFISAIVIVASVYLTINLVAVNEIRDSTQNSAEFWNSVMKGLTYVFFLFMVWYAYFKQLEATKGED